MSWERKATFATLPRTERGKPIVLGGDPKGKNFLYCNGNSVIIREIANPAISDIYTEHATQTTVAQYAPSGFYIASADVSGKLRIWDTTQKEHILKNEFQPMAGIIKDITWTGDSQRIAVGGEGRQKFGHVFSADTGTSVGEIMGQSRPLNAVAFRKDRPFRLATASEDNTIAFFHGPPFKFQFTNTDHSRFVNALRYAPDGSTFISGGADGKCFIYDGKTGEKKGELGSPAHKGGVYAVSYCADSKKILTASADKTAKIWDIETSSVVTEFTLGTTVDDMQVGCLWQGDYLLSVSLTGHINYLDKNNPTTPLRILKGHNKPITALTVSEDKSTIFTGSSDGRVCSWDAQSGESDMVAGKGHSNQVQDMCISDDTLVTCGMDDSLIFSQISSKQFGDKVSVPSQPKSVSAVSGGLAVAACQNEVVVLRNGRVVNAHKVSYEPLSVAIHPGQTDVAVGAGMDNKLRIYTLNGDTLTEKLELEHHGNVTDVKYSPDGAYLAASDTFRKVVAYSLPDYKNVVTTEWGYHTAKVNTLSWTPDSRHVASGALDTNLIDWSPENKNKYVVVKGAHPMSQITRVKWLDNNTLLSVGQDSNLKQWSITHY